jgi:hypothetical protein
MIAEPNTSRFSRSAKRAAVRSPEPNSKPPESTSKDINTCEVSSSRHLPHVTAKGKAFTISRYHHTKQKEKKSDVMALAPVATVRVLGNSNADTHQTEAVYRLR